jgi:hypothetical protein
MTYVPYLSTSAINKKIPSPAPVHPDTAKMISTGNHWLGTGTWLGPRGPEVYYRGDTTKLPKVTMYANQNGWVGAGPFTMPLPSWAASVIGPVCEKGDSNVFIVDSITGDVWELWRCTPPGYLPRVTHDSAGKPVPSNRWNCNAYRHWPKDTTTQTGYQSGVPGTSATHIHMTAGLLVPEDMEDCLGSSDPGTVIPHALRIGSFCGALDPKLGGAHPRFVAPAMSGDGQQKEGIPAGARIQLDPSIDVTKWPSVVALRPPWRWGMMKLLRTMQQYGVFQADSDAAIGAGNIYMAGAASVAKGGANYPVGFRYPNDVAGYGWGVANGVPEDLMGHFRVIDWTKWTGV